MAQLNQPMQEPVHEFREPRGRHFWIWTVLLVGILATGAYFRFVGINWDDFQHLHPDERFLTMVASSVSSPSSLGEYFDTQKSPFNPNNRGYGFYVYGTLPLFITRMVGEWLGKVGYDEIHLVGRFLSGTADLLTVLLVYLIALRLFGNRHLGLLAASFSAGAVMQIQLSHYFTVDTFANFFTFLAIYFAVCLMTSPDIGSETLLTSLTGDSHELTTAEQSRSGWKLLVSNRKGLGNYLWFGAALGLAMASKVSAAPLALMLPAAAAVWYFKLPQQRPAGLFWIVFRNLVAAAMVAFFVFRIFQPYAFSGPGFFGLWPNEKWVNNLRELSQQSGGNVDFPPALQWARRPITFAGENLALWGLGLPLGVLAFCGFLWMGWRILSGDWKNYVLIWGWTAFYFSWQSINFSRSMRYQLPVYPTFAIIAAWAVFRLWSFARKPDQAKNKNRENWRRVSSSLIALAVLSCTFLWAYAFTRIYTRPVTRIEASRWIYDNVPAALNFKIETGQSSGNQPVGFRSRMTLSSERPVIIAFEVEKEGYLSGVTFAHIANSAAVSGDTPDLKSLVIQISSDANGSRLAAGGLLVNEFSASGDQLGDPYQVALNPGVNVHVGEHYYLIIGLAEKESSLNISGAVMLNFQTTEGVKQQYLPDLVNAVQFDAPFLTSFTALADGILTEASLPHVVDWLADPSLKTLSLTVASESGESTAQVQSDLLAREDPRGEATIFQFDPPLSIKKGKTYTITLRLLDSDGAVGIYGSKHAIESSWDDSLPLGLPGYNPYDYDTGSFRSELNFEMYWDDNEEKLDRFKTILDQVDYIFISSNRQWGTTVRVPERYPLTSVYYRDLIGCPEDKDILWCYRVAEPGKFSGELGFDLIQVFQSDPNLGTIRFNTQFAEEAFTVYDHPKVLIFKKRTDYDPDRVSGILDAVDLSKVVHLTPGMAGSYQAEEKTLLLPKERLEVQQAGGTWSELFNRQSLVNRWPVLSGIVWYLVVWLLGCSVYPLVRLGFSGLQDHGYPFSRLIGMLLLAYLVWLVGSANLQVTRSTISLVFLFILGINTILFWWQRDGIVQDWKEHRRAWIAAELVFLGLFLAFLFVRLGNPDLWHPYKGGEKPMDFSYLNAVIKSTTYPPYDPWFEGGYINYYYFGFVLVGVLVKWLGIIPSTAYNLILPTFFALLGTGAFSIGWNLKESSIKAQCNEETILGLKRTPFFSGLATTAAMLLIGNLGTVRMIWNGFQKIVAVGNPEDASYLQRWLWFFQGIGKLFSGGSFSYSPGDWYWIPSRAIPGEPITEFPLFTFLYADPHAHMFALPMTVVTLGWALSILRIFREQKDRNEPRWVKIAAAFLLGSLVIGSLRPMNTWDLPTFLAIPAVALFYSILRYYPVSKFGRWPAIPVWLKQTGIAILGVILLVFLVFALYTPFSAWYGQGYNAIDPWEGDHTPVGSYLTHWGLFLFVIVSWFMWETIDWMASTPVSALNQLRPYRNIFRGLLALLVILTLVMLVMGVNIAWLVLLLAAWAAVLLFRQDVSEEKRAVMFITATALVLTLAVEVIVLRGDIGRMNTVFKFYLQAWTLLSISAAAALGWLYPAVLKKWNPKWRTGWQTILLLLVVGAGLFTVTASSDKIRDRITKEAPHVLDGMNYMAYSTYSDQEKEMDLSQDYRAIQWMQDNIQGSPVIVEANTPEYRWGSRFTIYTGLPGVVGWNWHQRQQRAVVPSEEVTRRVDEVETFYETQDRTAAVEFLKLHNVRYIVVGQLEQAYYPGPGLEKFEKWNDDLWREVYREKDTVIYEVLP